MESEDGGREDGGVKEAGTIMEQKHTQRELGTVD